MRKFNIAGLALFFAASVFYVITLWNNIALSPFILLLMLILVGVTFLGIDRWVGDLRYGSLVVAILWTIYWGFVAFGFFGIAALFAFGVGFGHGEARQTALWYLLGYFGLVIAFGLTAVANLIRFFVGLFSLPKLGSTNR